MPKPDNDFQWIDAPGVRIEGPPKGGKPWDVIFMVNHTGESPLRVRNPFGCHSDTGCIYFNNQYFPVGPLQVISPLGQNLRVDILEHRDAMACQTCKARDVLEYHLYLESA